MARHPRRDVLEREGKGRLLFVNKKKQKNFIYPGPWALAAPTPMAQRCQKFLRRFFQKAATSSAAN
jgi:hypothetical protein